MADEKSQAANLTDRAEANTSSGHEKQQNGDSGGFGRKTETIHQFQEAKGYIIDVNAEDATEASDLKLAGDGHTVLIPQPSDDKNDPLNWSWARKHLILFVVSFVAFLPDYGSATGAVTLIPQAA